MRTAPSARDAHGVGKGWGILGFFGSATGDAARARGGRSMSTDGPEGGHAVPSVRNDLSGIVHGSAVQAQQIHGGVTFNVQPLPTAATPQVKPDQVPAVTVPFANRHEELARLDGLIGAGGAQPSPVRHGVVGGLPGIGKTALVWRWAEKSRERFPDGQIYVDFAALRHEAGGDVSEAVGMCLRALGLTDAFMPKSLAERTNEFRSRTAGRRLLVVLDDVSQPAHVRPFVPKGPGSFLLVTSNGDLSELAWDGAALMSLGPLDADSGLRLLAGRCGADVVAAERTAAERLVELCGGLPVALHVVASRLLTEERLTMPVLADELADEARRLTGMSLGGDRSVSAVLSLAYRALPPDAARLYRLLGWLPGRTFDAGTAAVAAAVSPATAAPLLTALTRASLLETMEDGRFRFHDLVRLHARERAAEEEPEDQRRAVTERVATHYLALTAFADRAIRADRLRVADLTELLGNAPDPFTATSGPQPLAWLEAERTNILAVLRVAHRHGLHALVWPLSEGFTALFLHSRHLGEWQESLELGASAAAGSGDPAGEARLRSLLSRPLMDLGEHERAHTELERAVACAEESGHRELQASVQEFFGRYWDRFDPPRAMAAYERAIELNAAAGQERGAAIATYFLGCTQDAVGDHDAARATLRTAHQRLLSCQDRRMAARALAALGTAQEHLGETEQASRALNEAAGILRNEKASHYEAQALVRLARLTERTGGPPHEVREHVARALEIWEAGGNPEADDLRQWLHRLDAAAASGEDG
ncbi:NB-ARC domain-containing protein [Streptomyces litchfieldiae]|uniref:NB-ARC domain-containing protein n=1 Tax=Streptomyces litchfieldiae TaxID=3075543 RepID=A0ABU2N1K0_9ACTN|nr:NB-ARC domain-containing protein [Streptomyces sp. DSM 44938]MDT0347472.1 NB-ARC domain-containing protein [Streptomyces sp. DSM 44938]